MPEWICASYLIETPLLVEQAAAALAGEQSSGTFVALPGETDELTHRFAARRPVILSTELGASLELGGGSLVLLSQNL